MNTGKIASQAGHAYLDAYLQKHNNLKTAQHNNLTVAQEYLLSPTKICLGADEREFVKLDRYLSDHNLQHVRIIDPDFTIQHGEVIRNEGNYAPAFTAIGIGPITNEERPPPLKRLKLLT